MNKRHLDALLGETEEWNRAWNPYGDGPDINVDRLYFGERLQGAPHADLSGADLSGLDLTGVCLHWADLTAADLSGSRLDRADLLSAHVRGACFSSASLRQADLRDIVGDCLTEFRGADMTGAGFSDRSRQSRLVDEDDLRDLPRALARWRTLGTRRGLDPEAAVRACRSILAKAGETCPGGAVVCDVRHIWCIGVLLDLWCTRENAGLEEARKLCAGKEWRYLDPEHISGALSRLEQLYASGTPAAVSGEDDVTARSLDWLTTAPLLAELKLPQGALEHYVPPEGDPNPFFSTGKIIHLLRLGEGEEGPSPAVTNLLHQLNPLAVLDCLLAGRGMRGRLADLEALSGSGVRAVAVTGRAIWVLESPLFRKSGHPLQ